MKILERNDEQKCFHIMNSSALGTCEFIQHNFHLYEKSNSTIKKMGLSTMVEKGHFKQADETIWMEKKNFLENVLHMAE